MIDIVLNHASKSSNGLPTLKGSGQGHDFFKVVKDWNGMLKSKGRDHLNYFKRFELMMV